MERRRRARRLILAALVAVPLASLGTSHRAPSAASAVAQPSYAYQVLAGEMDYSVDLDQWCTYGGGLGHPCTDADGGRRTTAFDSHTWSNIRLSVAGPGRQVTTIAGSSMNLAAPTRIEDYHYRNISTSTRYSTSCGTFTDTSDTSLASYDQTSPSYMDAALVIASDAEMGAFGLTLAPSVGTEPRFGWATVPGLTYNSSSRYGIAHTVKTTTYASPWCGSNGTSDGTLINPLGLAGIRHDTDTLESVELRECTTPNDCIYRVEGVHTWTYDPVHDGLNYEGSAEVDWWFDIRVTGDRVVCNDGTLDVTGDKASLPWAKVSIQGRVCNGRLVPGAVGVIGDVLLPPLTYAALQTQYSLEWEDPPRIEESPTGNMTTITSRLNLCLGVDAVIPGGWSKGIGRAVRWASGPGTGKLVRGLTKFMTKQYNRQLDTVIQGLSDRDPGGQLELLSDLETRRYLDDLLETGFSAPTWHLLDELGRIPKVCPAAWELTVSLYPESDSSGLEYFFDPGSSSSGLHGVVTNEFRARPI